MKNRQHSILALIISSFALTPSQISGQLLQVEGTRYDPPGGPAPAADRNRLELSVNARSVFRGTDANIGNTTNITIACFMNTLEVSTANNRDWLDINRSCVTNTQPPPDYPSECAHAQGLRLIEKWEETGNLDALFVECYKSGIGPVWTIERCYNSTHNNFYRGWSEGGLNWAVFGGSGRHHEFKREQLPDGETICHRHFQLQGMVSGMEAGDVVRIELEAPDETGTVQLWDIPPVQPATGTLIAKLPQVAEGGSYEARVAVMPQKKTCTFNRNDEAAIRATFAQVDDSGRTSGGIDLTDLSITCECNDGQESCAADGVLNVQATGIEPGEAAHLNVQIQHPSGQTLGSENFPVPGSGTFTIVSNLPQGSSYDVSFHSFSPAGKSCLVSGGSGTIGPDGAVVQLSCSCPTGTSAGSRVADAASLGCGESPRNPGEPLEEIEWFDICQHVERLCPTLDPWWWGDLGPSTGREPCQRQTVCVEGPWECWTDPETGEEYCGPSLVCTDRCVPQSRLVLQGPYVSVDGDRDLPLSGRVLLSGWASDDEGVQLLRLYLDGQPLVLDDFRDDVSRPEACGPIQGDCAPVGFQGQLDTTQWPDGTHKLIVFAVDGRRDYPVPTAFELDLVFDNSCTSTTPPTGSLVSPIAGATVAGPVPVEVAASSSEGVERVRFYLDGARVFTDWTAPYAWNWQTAGAPDGQHRLHADVMDTCGNVATTAERTVTVRNANNLPALAVETPTPLLDLAGIAPVSGWAVDADRVGSIVLRLDGQSLPLASPLTWTNRSDVCSSAGVADPRCPNVGWSTSFDTTRWPDGSYRLDVVAVDGRGGSTSRSVFLSIRNTPVTAPTVSTPASKTVVAGNDVSFQVTAAGEGPLAYQWQYRSGTTWRFLAEGDRGGRVRGVLTRTLILHDVVTSDATAYRCLVSNEGGTTASGSASLTVEETIAPPTVTAGLDQRMSEGETALLSVSAQGAGPLSFRWQRWNGSWVNVLDGNRITGSATSTLTIFNSVVADQGLYRALVSNDGGTTTSAAIELTVDPIPVGTCVPNATTLCFQADRFAVTATFNGSPAWSMPFSEEGGFFWAFEPNTVEVVVKILDGRGVNGHFWVFHGALTDLAYTLTVTDTITGVVKTYLKGAGHFCGDADTAAFGGSTSSGLMVPLGPASISAPLATCQSSPTAACLFNDKFRVEVHRAGAPQPGVAVTDLSASFGFVSASAPEVVVKVIDGTSVNGWYWLFFGSLTHQAFTVEVTDTATGEHRSYASPDDFCGEGDTAAF